ncbi:MAG: hypothetical protein GKR89_35815 [Candidatus Latescibacteria bacterium]|nr:hypothetical protein [Candidatus Latescibacterota bacterium]
MRIATGSITHESSTFTTVATTRDSFRSQRFGYLQGAQVLERFEGTNSAVGGFLAGCRENGHELLPTIYAGATPSAPAPRAVFDEILDDLLAHLERLGPVDGVLLDLHGAMVAEGVDDGEGHILSAVRQLVGPHVPIIAQFDIHSNVSPTMVEMADVMLGHRTYPEIDQEQRGRQCADIMHRVLTQGLKPTLALHQLPLMWGMNQITAHPPMRPAIDYLLEIESRPGIICASIATCFPIADIPDMGASVYIAADDDMALAQSCADELAAWIWERRADWQISMPATREALPTAEQYPLVLADRDDNTGGGAPGDSTGMLRTFIDEDLQDACILYIVDPEAVAQCQQAGVGACIQLQVGAKSTPLQGQPVPMDAEVISLSDGHFNYEGPRYRGLSGTMGPSAYIRQGGVHVLLVTRREQPFGLAFSLTMGLDPRQMRYVGVKSAAHFRAGFEPWAGQIIVVSEPCVHNAEILTFKNLGRKIYPLDDI